MVTYCKPGTSKPLPGHEISPYLLTKPNAADLSFDLGEPHMCRNRPGIPERILINCGSQSYLVACYENGKQPRNDQKANYLLG